jgi:ribosomal protein S18 acetylase RimI-like enzyme
MDDAGRVHEALRSMFELTAAVLPETRFERRDGYDFLACPEVPIPQFSGVWPLDDAAAPSLEGALSEIEEMCLPYSVQLRGGATPAFEAEARRLGLTSEEWIPGMVVRPGELASLDVPALQIVRIATADGMAQALAVAAAGFGARADLLAPVYALELLELDGSAYYLGRVDGRDVSTAVGFTVEDTVGVFNVATPPEHRGHGYGAALTAQAARDGFAAGAELAWLQSSDMGHSVYRRLGFRDVQTYLLLTRPSQGSQ